MRLHQTINFFYTNIYSYRSASFRVLRRNRFIYASFQSRPQKRTAFWRLSDLKEMGFDDTPFQRTRTKFSIPHGEYRNKLESYQKLCEDLKQRLTK